MQHLSILGQDNVVGVDFEPPHHYDDEGCPKRYFLKLVSLPANYSKLQEWMIWSQSSRISFVFFLLPVAQMMIGGSPRSQKSCGYVVATLLPKNAPSVMLLLASPLMRKHDMLPAPYCASMNMSPRWRSVGPGPPLDGGPGMVVKFVLYSCG